MATQASTKQTTPNKKKPTSPTTKIDLLWKDLFTEFNSEAILFFLGKRAHDAIDFSCPPDFLEQELNETFAGNSPSKKITDKIVRYKLKNGKFRYLILHVEFQGKAERNFAERMFRYFVFIYMKYGCKDVTALAIYTGAARPKVFDVFTISCYGTKLTYKFNTYTVRDQNEAKLLRSTNPMALAVLASLWLIKAGKDVKQKLAYKKNLVEIARKKGYDRAKLLRLINFVRYIMLLPAKEELEFKKFITQPENNVKMTYEVDFLEMVAGDTITQIRAKALEEGLEKGIRRERAEREKERAEREKERAEREKERAEREKELEKERAGHEKERAEREKERAEREKEREEERAAREKELEEVIIGIHDKLGLDAKVIATMLPHKIEYIQSVIDKFEKKKAEKGS